MQASGTAESLAEQAPGGCLCCEREVEGATTAPHCTCWHGAGCGWAGRAAVTWCARWRRPSSSSAHCACGGARVRLYHPPPGTRCYPKLLLYSRRPRPRPGCRQNTSCMLRFKCRKLSHPMLPRRPFMRHAHSSNSAIMTCSAHRHRYQTKDAPCPIFPMYNSRRI